MLESIDFLIGEKKKVPICVQSINQAPFEVADAMWELMCGDEVESSGVCTIDPIRRGKVVLSALVQPMRGAISYRLVYTYTIAPETFKHVVRVRVS